MDKGSPGEFGNLLVVLNVDGSSPSGHPSKTPVSQRLAGVFVLCWHWCVTLFWARKRLKNNANSENRRKIAAKKTEQFVKTYNFEMFTY